MNFIITRFTRFVLSALVGILSLVGCKPVDLLNATVSRKGYTVHYDLAYGEDPRQKVDIYVPDTLSTPHTTLIYFYGGSWQFGDKNMYRFVGQALASKGYIAVIVNYRLYPQVYFPEFMHDGAKAVRWVHEHIQEYGGSPNNVFLVGHSAGAHIAVLLMTDSQYLTAEGAKRGWIKGTVGIAGPYDFLPFTDPKVKALFGKVDAYKTQPINFVGSGLPPFLLVTGAKDTQVYPKNTINLAHKLRYYKVPVTEIIYPKIGHIGIILSLAAGFRYKAPLLEDITRFVSLVNGRD